MLPVAEAIRTRADANDGESKAWLLDYDAITGLFDVDDSILPTTDDVRAGELVLMFDWSIASQRMSAGWTEAWGNASYSRCWLAWAWPIHRPAPAKACT